MERHNDRAIGHQSPERAGSVSDMWYDGIDQGIGYKMGSKEPCLAYFVHDNSGFPLTLFLRGMGKT